MKKLILVLIAVVNLTGFRWHYIKHVDEMTDQPETLVASVYTDDYQELALILLCESGKRALIAQFDRYGGESTSETVMIRIDKNEPLTFTRELTGRGMVSVESGDGPFAELVEQMQNGKRIIVRHKFDTGTANQEWTLLNSGNAIAEWSTECGVMGW